MPMACTCPCHTKDPYPCESCCTGPAPTPEAVERVARLVEAVLDRVERIDEPAWTGYDLDWVCQMLRDARAALAAMKSEGG